MVLGVVVGVFVAVEVGVWVGVLGSLWVSSTLPRTRMPIEVEPTAASPTRKHAIGIGYTGYLLDVSEHRVLLLNGHSGRDESVDELVSGLSQLFPAETLTLVASVESATAYRLLMSIPVATGTTASSGVVKSNPMGPAASALVVVEPP